MSDIDYKIKFKLVNHYSLRIFKNLLTCISVFSNLIVKGFFNYRLSDNYFFIGIKNYIYTGIRITPANEFIVKDEFLEEQLGKLCFNDLNHDNYKWVISYSDNTIKIYSSKDNMICYHLYGGTTTVIPKSFVVHPTITGFTNICLTKYSIIGTIGNLIRVYNFSN